MPRKLAEYHALGLLASEVESECSDIVVSLNTGDQVLGAANPVTILIDEGQVLLSARQSVCSPREMRLDRGKTRGIYSR
jgi:hypothetical protein